MRGTHTCKITYHLHRCPKCGFINESRTDYYLDRDGMLAKHVECDRCGSEFFVTKKPRRRPLIDHETEKKA